MKFALLFHYNKFLQVPEIVFDARLKSEKFSACIAEIIGMMNILVQLI